ncbi:MAG: transport permease protein [Acidimicrobiales bacterium]|nr:MAG: transport permease protein [Acidimicrobiales bacterium]
MTAVLDAPRSRLIVSIEQVWSLSVRATVATFRRPTDFIPGLVFPLLMAAVYASQFSRAVDLPAFPEVDSFLQFILPSSILQGIAFNASNAGSDMATDIETGFFDRLISSPVARQSVLIGRVAGAASAAAVQAIVLMSIFLLFGAPVKSGLAGAVALVIISVALGVAISGFGLAVAIRTGSTEATQAMFPLIFVMIFISSAFFPTALMRGWYQSVAEINPFTLIIDPTRNLVISGWSWSDFGQALAMTALVAVVSLGLAYRAYLRRLRVS